MRIVPPPTQTLLLLAVLCLVPNPVAAQNPTQIQPDDSTTTPAEPPANVDRLSAVVVSSLDGRPVPRVLVTSPDRRMAVLTDSEGRFSFDLRRTASPSQPQIFSSFPPTPAAPANTMSIQFMVRKPGYITDNLTLRVPAAKPDTPEPTLQLKITPAAALTGHVYAESGDLPANLFVQLRRRQIQDGAAIWMQTGGATVNSRGEFRIANLQPGDYKLMTDGRVLNQQAIAQTPLAPAKPDSTLGLLPAFYPSADSLDSATAIHLGPGETATANLTTRTATFYRVVIPVADGPDPAKGVGVSLLPDSAGLNLAFNSQSRQLEGYLPAGSYTARLTWNGQPPSTAIAHLRVNAAPVLAPPVHPNASADLPIVIHREFTNTSATQPGNQGPSVFVNVQSIDPVGVNAGLAPVKSGETDEGLRIQNLSEGLYRVSVYPRIGYVAAVTSGATDLLHDPLGVSAAGTAAPIEITLRDDFATLNLRLASSDPSSQTGDNSQIFLLVISLDRPQSQSFVVSWQGGQNQYTLPQQPPGRYLVLASHNQQALQNLEYRNPDVLRDLLSKGVTVTLSAGDKSDVQVPLMPEDTN